MWRGNAPGYEVGLIHQPEAVGQRLLSQV